MKFYKLISLILIVFFKTETLFSENNLFNVNNIELEKNDKVTNNALADQAIKKGFDQLIERILLKEDSKKLVDLSFLSIKQLVTYYQVSNSLDTASKKRLVNFSVTFDKEKIHNLFYNRGISYSEISDKDLFVLPVFVQEGEIFVFNNNYFYENWNKIYADNLIEFILPLEKIEIIKKINENKNNLINLNINELFQEYTDKNLAFVLIENEGNNNEKVYIKAIIQNKKISKNINLKKLELSNQSFYEQIIVETKKELIDLVKSKNLIDIRTPSFLNVRLDINKKSNLVELNSRIKNMDSVENIYVQNFNMNYMNLRIKYLGKLEKLISQLKIKNIDLQLINDKWVIKTL